MTDRRDLILDQAAAVLLQHGYEALTMSQVAEVAGLSRTVIYRHVSSKPALTGELVRRELAGYNRRWRSEVDLQPDAGTVPSFYRAAFRAIVGHPLLIAIGTRNRDVFGSYLSRPDCAVPTDRGAWGMHGFLAAMQQAGTIRPEVDLESMAVVMDALHPALLAGLDQQNSADGLADHDRLLETVTELLDRMLTPEQPDRSAALAAVDAVLETGAEKGNHADHHLQRGLAR